MNPRNNTFLQVFLPPACLCLCLLLLTGCGALTPQKDPTRHFVLTSSTLPKQLTASDLAVGVGPVTLPGYLDHKEIVTAGPSNHLTLADFHVWAEPLDKALSRVVANNLSQILGSPAIVPFPEADVKPDYRISIIVRRFEMVAQGRVHLDASYTIESSSGSERNGSAHSRTITIGVNRPDDYSAVVAAMSEAAGELSSTMARDLLALHRKHRDAVSPLN